MRLATTLKKIQLAQIHVPQSRDTWRPASRCSPQALAELVDQIEAVGWVEAVVVRERLSGGYELLDGERRVEAERKHGSTTIDAVVVRADDATAAAVTLLAQLPKARLPAIHWARLVEWVGTVQRQQGRRATNEEIARRIGRDASTVSRHRAVQKGLPPTVLDRLGLVDEDLEEVPGEALQALAKCPRKKRVSTLRKVRDAKLNGADAQRIARCVAKAVSPTKRGRPTKPYTLTQRSDGRVRFTLSGSALDASTAREALTRLGPVLQGLSDAAGVASLDAFLGVGRPTLATRTFRRISLLHNRMHDLVAAKMPALGAWYKAAGLGSAGPIATK